MVRLDMVGDVGKGERSRCCSYVEAGMGGASAGYKDLLHCDGGLISSSIGPKETGWPRFSSKAVGEALAN